MFPLLRATGFRTTLIAALVASGAGCALNRPQVKSLRDLQADRIQFDTVIPTTITALNTLPSKCGPTLDHRVRDEEFRVYQIVGRIRRVKREPDHDVHIVLEEAADARQHLIIESGDPDFRGNVRSPHRDKLATARQMFDDLVKQSGEAQIKDLRGTLVRVTGVGFFDMNHFQRGRSRSCVELHPILSIERVSP